MNNERLYRCHIGTRRNIHGDCEGIERKRCAIGRRVIERGRNNIEQFNVATNCNGNRTIKCSPTTRKKNNNCIDLAIDRSDDPLRCSVGRFRKSDGKCHGIKRSPCENGYRYTKIESRCLPKKASELSFINLSNFSPMMRTNDTEISANASAERRNSNSTERRKKNSKNDVPSAGRRSNSNKNNLSFSVPSFDSYKNNNNNTAKTNIASEINSDLLAFDFRNSEINDSSNPAKRKRSRSISISSKK